MSTANSSSGSVKVVRAGKALVLINFDPAFHASTAFRCWGDMSYASTTLAAAVLPNGGLCPTSYCAHDRCLTNRASTHLVCHGEVSVEMSHDDLVVTKTREGIVDYLKHTVTEAERVFGEKSKAAAWVSQPRAVFGDKSALELAYDEAGYQRVKEELARLEQGFVC